MIMTTFLHALKTETIFLSILLFVIIMPPRPGGCLSQGVTVRCAVETRLTEPLQRQDLIEHLCVELSPRLGKNPAEPSLSPAICWKASYVGPSHSDHIERQGHKQTWASFSLSLFLYLLHPSIHPFEHAFRKICLALTTVLDQRSGSQSVVFGSLGGLWDPYRSETGLLTWIEAVVTSVLGSLDSSWPCMHSKNETKLVLLNLHLWGHISFVFCVRKWGDTQNSAYGSLMVALTTNTGGLFGWCAKLDASFMDH